MCQPDHLVSLNNDINDIQVITYSGMAVAALMMVGLLHIMILMVMVMIMMVVMMMMVVVMIKLKKMLFICSCLP